MEVFPPEGYPLFYGKNFKIQKLSHDKVMITLIVICDDYVVSDEQVGGDR